MSSRRAVWRPSDIRDWGAPRAKRAGSRPEPLSPETIVQVRVGRDEWLTKLQWVVDLLSVDEVAAVHAAVAERRPMQLKQRANRAAFVISVPDVPTADDGA